MDTPGGPDSYSDSSDEYDRRHKKYYHEFIHHIPNRLQNQSVQEVDKEMKKTMRDLSATVQEANEKISADIRNSEVQGKSVLRQMMDDIIKRYEEDETPQRPLLERMREKRLLEEGPDAEVFEFDLGEDIDEAVILEDVVNEQYSISSVKSALEGANILEKRDPAEVSVLQLFDAVHERYKLKNQEILKDVNPQNFLDLCEADDLELIPVSLTDEIVSDATAGIEMMASLRSQRNEALEAFDCFHKAKVMYMNEKQLKQVADIVRGTNQKRQDLEEMLRDAGMPGTSISLTQAAAAITGALTLEDNLDIADFRRLQKPEDSSKSQDESSMGYTIKCDLSMLPSEDPDVYKPLEIISYIGMTKSVGVADPIQTSN